MRGEGGDRACGIEDIVLLPEEEEKHEPESVPEVKENVGGEKADPEEEEEEKIGAAMEDAGVKEDAEEEEERVSSPPGYTLEEDQFLVYSLYRFGYNEWELIRNSIRNDSRFMFNWTF